MYLFLDAATVVTAAPNTTVTLGPVYAFLEPYILAAFGVIFSALLTWALAIFQARTGLAISSSARDAMNTAAMNAAGRILASQEATFAHATIDVHSPLIAAEIPKVEASMKDEIGHLGLTPDRIASLIQGKLGVLQAQAQSLPGPAK